MSEKPCSGLDNGKVFKTAEKEKEEEEKERLVVKERSQEEVSNTCYEKLIVEQVYNSGALFNDSKQVPRQEEHEKASTCVQKSKSETNELHATPLQ